MKILTWNSSMKFREKIKRILPLAPDIAVIPECEAKEKWRSSKYEEYIKQFLWFGNNPNKGIGVFSFNEEFKLELHPDYNPDYKYIIPIKVSGEEDFILLAVWTQNSNKQFDSYIGQLFLALEHYKLLLNKPCFIMGDWNSNKIFDHIKRVGNHSEVLEMLKSHDIYSVYHKYFKEEQGEESRATHYFRKEVNLPFHIDYIFSSINYLSRLQTAEIGTYQDWIQYSDHVPIFATFEVEYGDGE